MMGCAIGPRPADPSTGERARDAGDHRDLQCLRWCQRRQNARQAARHERLARARRPDHEQVVSPGGGDFQCALGDLLPLDLRKVGGNARWLDFSGDGRRQQAGALQMAEQADQVARGQHLDIRRPRRLGALRRRADESEVVGTGMQRGQQDAWRLCDPAIERQFTNDAVARQRLGIDHAHGAEQRHRDRQVEMRPFLGEVRRREIDGDALGRERQADGGNGIAHPLPAFRDRLVG